MELGGPHWRRWRWRYSRAMKHHGRGRGHGANNNGNSRAGSSVGKVSLHDVCKHCSKNGHWTKDYRGKKEE